MAWESRYVGDLRVINEGMLDAYLLKSIDGFGLGALHGFKIVKCGANQTKICFFLKGDPAEWKDESTGKSRMVETIQLGQFSPKNDPWAANYVKQMGHARVNAERDHAKALQGTTNSDINLQLSGATIHTGKPGLLGGELAVDTETLHVVAAALEIPSLVDSLQQFGARNGNPYPMIFDRVIRCLGFQHVRRLFSVYASVCVQSARSCDTPFVLFACFLSCFRSVCCFFVFSPFLVYFCLSRFATC